MAQAPLDDEVESVSARVLKAFVAAVAEVPELTDVADRLRERVLAKGDVSETAFREALFGVEEA
jgi:hypothetical protein